MIKLLCLMTSLLLQDHRQTKDGALDVEENPVKESVNEVQVRAVKVKPQENFWWFFFMHILACSSCQTYSIKVPELLPTQPCCKDLLFRLLE